MNYKDYINTNIKFGSNPDFNKVKHYLDYYPILSEINAGFLTSGDPSYDPKVKALVHKLNKDPKRDYIIQAPYTKKYDTLKCIYDMNRITTPQKLIQVANLLYSYEFNN